MGAKCCAESKQVGAPSAIPDTMTDLKAVNLDGISDPYARFEASLPFARTLIGVMIQKIELAHRDCGETGFVTRQALRSHLTTNAWAALEDANSALSQTLDSIAF